jgi:hypothetical protein
MEQVFVVAGKSFQFGILIGEKRLPLVPGVLANGHDPERSLGIEHDPLTAGLVDEKGQPCTCFCKHLHRSIANGFVGFKTLKGLASHHARISTDLEFV